MFMVGDSLMERFSLGWPEDISRFSITGTATVTPQYVESDGTKYGWKFKRGVSLANCCHINARIFSKEMRNVEVNGQIHKVPHLLFELIDNEITQNFSSKYNRIGFHDGWKICDTDNMDVLELVLINGHVNVFGEFWDREIPVLRATRDEIHAIACPMSMG